VHDLSPEELRVLGSLLEKQRTTPDAYPLSLNGLRAACNQNTNRDPVVEYDEATVATAQAADRNMGNLHSCGLRAGCQTIPLSFLQE
jgi:uncharacterized protein YceH (UPF0502 family)